MPTKKRIIIGLSSLFIMSLIILGTTGCVPKKSASAATTVAGDYQSQISDLEVKIAKLQENVASIAIPTSSVSKSTVDAIAAQQDVLASNISNLSERIDALDKKVSTPTTTPVNTRSAYAEIAGKRYIDIKITGEGNYPVIVHLFGTGLVAGQITKGTADFIIKEEFLYGDYTDPTVLASYNGTQLVLVLEPTVAWAASSSVSLDIRAVIGDIYYASAYVGAR